MVDVASSEAEFLRVSSSFWISAKASSSPSRFATDWSVEGVGGVVVAGVGGAGGVGLVEDSGLSFSGSLESGLGSAIGDPMAGGGSFGPVSVLSSVGGVTGALEDGVVSGVSLVVVGVEGVVGGGVGVVGISGVAGAELSELVPGVVVVVVLLSFIEVSPFPSLSAISFANLIRLSVAFEYISSSLRIVE